MSNYKILHRRLDLCGTLERAEKHEQIRKREQEEAAAAAALSKRFDSAFAEQREKFRLAELAKSDPTLFFFLVKNRSITTA